MGLTRVSSPSGEVGRGAVMRTGELAAVAAVDVFGFGLIAHEGGLLRCEGASVLDGEVGEAAAGIDTFFA